MGESISKLGDLLDVARRLYERVGIGREELVKDIVGYYSFLVKEVNGRYELNLQIKKEWVGNVVSALLNGSESNLNESLLEKALRKDVAKFVSPGVPERIWRWIKKKFGKDPGWRKKKKVMETYGEDFEVVVQYALLIEALKATGWKMALYIALDKGIIGNFYG